MSFTRFTENSSKLRRSPSSWIEALGHFRKITSNARMKAKNVQHRFTYFPEFCGFSSNLIKTKPQISEKVQIFPSFLRFHSEFLRIFLGFVNFCECSRFIDCGKHSFACGWIFSHWANVRLQYSCMENMWIFGKGGVNNRCALFGQTGKKYIRSPVSHINVCEYAVQLI